MVWFGVILSLLIILLVIRKLAPGAFGEESVGNDGDRTPRQWPILARTHDRHEAHMIKALLDDANLPALVEEDRTMGVLYGLPAISKCVVRVPQDRYDEARGHLKESSFAGKIAESDDGP